MPDPAYENLAYAYDEATGIKSMQLLGPIVDDVRQRYPTPGQTHLDLACGTGLVLQFFQQRGYQSRGVDLSERALRIAGSRDAHVASADIRNLPHLGNFDWITCFNDSIRVLTSSSDLQACFNAVAAMMSAQSIFAFDTTTPEMLDTLISVGSFPFSGSHHEMTLQPAFADGNRIERLHFNGHVVVNSETLTINEVHDQGVFSREEFIEALGAASLRAVEIISFERFHDYPNSAWLFVAKRA